MTDRYEEQRKRNEKAKQAAKDAGKSRGWFRRETSDSLGRPSDNSETWSKGDVKPMTNRKVGLPDNDPSGDAGWDSGNSDEPITWDD